MQIRYLHEFSLQDVVRLWNEGFQGYFVNLTMTLDAFLKRVANDQLSLDKSFAIVKDDRPIGFVMNGFRRIHGQRVAWNGGTAIVPEYRLQGLGKRLMEEAILLYQREDVDVAWLEAIKGNDPAIALYQRHGYEIIDHLTFYHHEGVLPHNAFVEGQENVQDNRLVYQAGIPQDVLHLSFYDHRLPWQSQAASVQNGEALIAKDGGQAVGYALYKRLFNDEGEHMTTLLYQCVANPLYDHQEDVLARMLQHVFVGSKPVTCRTMNWSQQHSSVSELLKKAGFQAQTEQVHMQLPIRSIT